MTQYVAKTNTGIYPYGTVRKGDVLEQKHLDVLGETGLSVLIANGVIAEVQVESGEWRAESGDEKPHDAPTPAPPEAVDVEPGEDFEDGEELTDLEGLDDLAGDAEGGTTSSVTADAATPSPEGEGKKPRSRKRTGGKKQ